MMIGLRIHRKAPATRTEKTRSNAGLLFFVNVLEHCSFLKKTKYCFNLLKNAINLKSRKYSAKTSRSQSSDKLNKYYNNINMNKFISYNNNFYQKSQEGFLKRMDKYNNKKESNKKIQQCLKEEEINFICTFSPDL